MLQIYIKYIARVCVKTLAFEHSCEIRGNADNSEGTE